MEQWAEHFALHPPGEERLLTTEELPLVRALRGETVRNMQLETRGQDGARAVLNVSGGPVLDAEGQIQGGMVVMQDMTERTDMETALKLGNVVAANLAVGVSMIRASDGEFVYANEQWERLFGYGRGELLGKHISVINAPTDVTPEQRAQSIFDALDRDGRWAGEVHNLRKDGTELWTACNVSRFEHPKHGSVWISANTDITARKRDDAARDDAAERFRLLFEDAPVGIALVSTDGQVVDANRCFSELAGWRRDDLVGRRLADIVHPDDREFDEELSARVFNGELPRLRVERRLVTRHGENVRAVLTSTVARDPSGRPLYWITTADTTAGPDSPEADDVT
jgi:PAS domain S-box-containing protein